MYQDHVTMRNTGVAHWIAFVRLMIRINEKVTVKGRQINAFTFLVFDCLCTLCQKPCVENLEEVQYL